MIKWSCWDLKSDLNGSCFFLPVVIVVIVFFFSPTSVSYPYSRSSRDVHLSEGIEPAASSSISQALYRPS